MLPHGPTSLCSSTQSRTAALSLLQLCRFAALQLPVSMTKAAPPAQAPPPPAGVAFLKLRCAFVLPSPNANETTGQAPQFKLKNDSNHGDFSSGSVWVHQVDGL